MPQVQSGETQDAFVTRCIPIVIEDGTAANPDQAVAICNSIYEESKKSMFKGAIFRKNK